MGVSPQGHKRWETRHLHTTRAGAECLAIEGHAPWIAAHDSQRPMGAAQFQRGAQRVNDWCGPWIFSLCLSKLRGRYVT